MYELLETSIGVRAVYECVVMAVSDSYSIATTSIICPRSCVCVCVRVCVYARAIFHGFFLPVVCV